MLLACLTCVALGYKWGGDSVQAEWDKAVQRWADNAAASSAAYEKEKTDLENKAAKARKELAHAISKDSSLSGCNATPEFLRVYDSAVAR